MRIKRRLLSFLLATVMVLTTVSVPAFALETDGITGNETSITYSLSDDGKTLMFSGSGAIGTDVIGDIWTNHKEWLQTIENVVIGEGITELSGYRYSSAFLYSGSTVNITIQGQGSFRFENFACKDLEVSLTANDRDGIEIGNNAFASATLNKFPIDKITKVESSGLSRATLPVKGTTLNLNLKGTADTELCLGTSALSYSKNCDGNAFTTLDLTVSGNVNLGNPAASGSNIFGDKFTSASIHLEDGAQLILNTGFGGNVKLETLTFTGSGTVYFQPPNTDYLKGNCLHKAVKLKTIDFSGFSGEIQFADNMFNTSTSRPTSAFDKPILKEVLFGDGCRVTRIGQNAFNFCEQLETFDFSKVQGPIGERSFQLANLSGIADLSGVTAIGQRAFEGVEKIDWKNTIFPENLDSVQLEYSTPFKDNEKVWQYVKAALDNKFCLNQDGSYAALQPSGNGWESSKYGEQNTTDSGSTQLTKSAKWTDNEKTEAAVEIQAAYAPNKQMDFVFVLDTSDSMRSVSTDGADMGKGYVVVSSTEKEYRYKVDRRHWETVILWETVLQTPYPIDFTEEQAREETKELIGNDGRGNWLIARLGINMYYGGDYEDLLENSKWNDPQPEEHNIMFKGRLRANYRAGYWEIIFSHTKPLEIVPADMRTR